MRALNVFVDVDYTLLSASGLLRPNARELFEALTSAGHGLYVWSGMGIRRDEIAGHKLGGFVSGYAVKPVEDYLGALERTPPPAWPDLVLDDHDAIVRALGGVVIRPYFFVDPSDTELRHAASMVLEFAETGGCEHPAFVQPPVMRPGGRGSA